MTILMPASLRLPKETIDAIKGGRKFPGSDTYDDLVRKKNWVFPKGISADYDRRYLALYAANLTHLGIHLSELGGDLGIEILEAARSEMRRAVQEESSFKSRKITEFVNGAALKIYQMVADGADGIPDQSERLVVKISTANAIGGLWKQMHIERALADYYIEDVTDQISRQFKAMANRVNSIQDLADYTRGFNKAIKRALE